MLVAPQYFLNKNNLLGILLRKPSYSMRVGGFFLSEKTVGSFCCITFV